MLVALALALSPLLRGSADQVVVLVLGLAGVAVLCGGLALRWGAALAFAVAVLGSEQAVRLADGPDALDRWTPLYAGAFLLVAELAYWSIERRVPAWAEHGAALRRVATVLLTCAGGTLVAAFVVIVSGAPVRGGFGLELAGVIAATGALAVVAVVARGRVG